MEYIIIAISVITLSMVVSMWFKVDEMEACCNKDTFPADKDPFNMMLDEHGKLVITKPKKKKVKRAIKMPTDLKKLK